MSTTAAGENASAARPIMHVLLFMWSRYTGSAGGAREICSYFRGVRCSGSPVNGEGIAWGTIRCVWSWWVVSTKPLGSTPLYDSGFYSTGIRKSLCNARRRPSEQAARGCACVVHGERLLLVGLSVPDPERVAHTCRGPQRGRSFRFVPSEKLINKASAGGRGVTHNVIYIWLHSR
jgi:hypothetical protein